MMCRRCDTVLPDETMVCPVCHKVLRRSAVKPCTPKIMVRIAILLAVLMSCINAFFLITVSHYPMNLDNGLLQARQALHHAYPALRAVDGIFFGMLLVCPVLIFVSQLTLRRAEPSAKVWILVTDLWLMIWAVAYPLAIQGVIGKPSPFFLFAVVQVVVFAVLSAVPIIYFFTSSRFAIRSIWAQIKE